MKRGLAPARLAALRVAVVAVVSAAVATACASDPFETLPVPPPNPSLSTTTSVPPDFSGVALAPVDGTTTTSEVAVGPGPVTLAGRVDGPDGPVAGASVRLERLVGDAVATLDVTSGEDGTWQAADVLGGRYRARAWLAPDLAGVEPQILFVGGGGPAPIVLAVERFSPTVVDLAVAPDPPQVGRRTNVGVRVSSRLVDDDGVVTVTPAPGVAVTLAAGGSWALEGVGMATTDEIGSATFTLVCRSPGPQPLTATLGSGEAFPLAPPDCLVPPPPTTAPPTTAPPTTSPSTTTAPGSPTPTTAP